MQCILRDRTLGNKEQVLSALHLVYIFISRKHIVLANIHCVILCYKSILKEKNAAHLNIPAALL